jgi:hypothetical protein
MQFIQFDEVTHLCVDHLEFEDIASALSTATNRLRGAAEDLPRIEQREQLFEQADRFEQMLKEMLDAARSDLAGLACSDALQLSSDHDHLPQKD